MQRVLSKLQALSIAPKEGLVHLYFLCCSSPYISQEIQYPSGCAAASPLREPLISLCLRPLSMPQLLPLLGRVLCTAAQVVVPMEGARAPILPVLHPPGFLQEC